MGLTMQLWGEVAIINSSNKIGLTSMILFVFIVVFGAFWAASAWSLMLTIAMVHNHWWDFIPTMGFGTAMAVTFFPFLFSVLFRIISEAVKEANK